MPVRGRSVDRRSKRRDGGHADSRDRVHGGRGTGCRAWAVDGIPDVVKDGTRLCRPADPAHLAEKIEIALEDDSGVTESGALATASTYDWARIAENYALCCENLLAERA